MLNILDPRAARAVEGIKSYSSSSSVIAAASIKTGAAMSPDSNSADQVESNNNNNATQSCCEFGGLRVHYQTLRMTISLWVEDVMKHHQIQSKNKNGDCAFVDVLLKPMHHHVESYGHSASTTSSEADSDSHEALANNNVKQPKLSTRTSTLHMSGESETIIESAKLLRQMCMQSQILFGQMMLTRDRLTLLSSLLRIHRRESTVVAELLRLLHQIFSLLSSSSAVSSNDAIYLLVEEVKSSSIIPILAALNTFYDKTQTGLSGDDGGGFHSSPAVARIHLETIKTLSAAYPHIDKKDDPNDEKQQQQQFLVDFALHVFVQSFKCGRLFCEVATPSQIPQVAPALVHSVKTMLRASLSSVPSLHISSVALLCSTLNEFIQSFGGNVMAKRLSACVTDMVGMSRKTFLLQTADGAKKSTITLETLTPILRLCATQLIVASNLEATSHALDTLHHFYCVEEVLKRNSAPGIGVLTSEALFSAMLSHNSVVTNVLASAKGVCSLSPTSPMMMMSSGSVGSGAAAAALPLRVVQKQVEVMLAFVGHTPGPASAAFVKNGGVRYVLHVIASSVNNRDPASSTVATCATECLTLVSRADETARCLLLDAQALFILGTRLRNISLVDNTSTTASGSNSLRPTIITLYRTLIESFTELFQTEHGQAVLPASASALLSDLIGVVRDNAKQQQQPGHHVIPRSDVKSILDIFLSSAVCSENNVSVNRWMCRQSWPEVSADILIQRHWLDVEDIVNPTLCLLFIMARSHEECASSIQRCQSAMIMLKRVSATGEGSGLLLETVQLAQEIVSLVSPTASS